MKLENKYGSANKNMIKEILNEYVVNRPNVDSEVSDKKEINQTHLDISKG